MLGATSPPPPDALGRLVDHWQTGAPAWLLLAVLVVASASYLAGARRLVRFERSWPALRSASFLAGLAVVEVALCSPLAAESRDRFSVRSVQLVALLDLAPTLLALGAPLSLLLAAAPRRARRLAGRVLAGRVVAAVTYPPAAVALVVLSTYGYLLSPLYGLSLRHPALLAAVDGELLAVGCLFWWRVASPDPLPRPMSDPLKLLYLGVTIPPGALLGIELIELVRPLSPGGSLPDTHVGGAVLWGAADLYTLAAIAAILLHWMRSEERAARQLEALARFDAVEAAEQIVAAAASSMLEHAEGTEDQDRP